MTGTDSLSGLNISLTGAILDSSPVPILMTDEKGLVLARNDAAEVLASIVDSPGGEAVRGLVAKASKHNTGVSERLKLTGPSGAIEYDITAIPLEKRSGFLVLAHDVTLDSTLQAALADSRQRYKDLVDISSDFAWETGADGTFTFVSPRGALGFVADELVGRDPAVFLLDPVETGGMPPFSTKSNVDDVELWMRQADGRPACLVATAAPLLSTEGDWIGARGVCRDITEVRERDAALASARHRERLLTYIVRTFRDEVEPGNMLSVAAQGISRGLSADSCQILHAEWDVQAGERNTLEIAATFGEDHGEDIILSLEAGLAEGAEHLELTVGSHRILAATTHFQRRINGAVCISREAGSKAWSDDDRILIGDIANQIGIAIEQIFNHMRIIEISRTDPLTGLLNRRAFFGELDRHFTRLRRDKKAAALMYVDLDNFKLVNDKFGHEQGDQVLLKMRDILLSRTRPTDLISRLGGDEFAVWLDGADEGVAATKAMDLLKACDEFEHLSASEEKPLKMSIGIAVFDPNSRETEEELINRADEAMYSVKRKGKGSFEMAPPPAERT